jgi:hypothetical protein
MALDSENLKTLVTASTEFEASAIASALEAEGIRAQAVGGFTAGFKAEAPGTVSVMVAESDLLRAQAVLADLKKEAGHVDWSQVDVDRPEDEDPGDVSG